MLLTQPWNPPACLTALPIIETSYTAIHPYAHLSSSQSRLGGSRNHIMSTPPRPTLHISVPYSIQKSSHPTRHISHPSTIYPTTQLL
ncbi:hypothetical protein EJ02DRAFT_99315 [Clathrospora elynae]|uniref:Uncharacterized protein n=1 Tax=Clathrospora elynae TaxID=706981 RepID=A0A6A5SXC4_9PLEO|nr:hypothetical protein EJ02DRAFT_99315 [Clathrospora elynae]